MRILDRAPGDSAKVLIALVTDWLTSFRSSIGIEKIIQVLDQGFLTSQQPFA